MNRKQGRRRGKSHVVLPLRTRKGSDEQRIVVRGVDGVLRTYRSWNEVPDSVKGDLQSFLDHRTDDAPKGSAESPSRLDVPTETVQLFVAASTSR
jgi:hypothetical protein